MLRLRLAPTLALLAACGSDPAEEGTFASVPCTPERADPYPDGIPYVGIHAEPGNSDVISCTTATSFGEHWRALEGLGLTQPNTFSPDGQTTYATTTNPEPDGCRLHAVDVSTGEVLWCRSYPPSVVQSDVEVD